MPCTVAGSTTLAWVSRRSQPTGRMQGSRRLMALPLCKQLLTLSACLHIVARRLHLLPPCAQCLHCSRGWSPHRHRICGVRKPSGGCGCHGQEQADDGQPLHVSVCAVLQRHLPGQATVLSNIIQHTCKPHCPDSTQPCLPALRSECFLAQKGDLERYRAKGGAY